MRLVSARARTIEAMHTTVFGRKDKELRRQALIDAANAVFAERGFDAATTREIAERAGCAEGLIHRYFAGKRGLLLAILDNRSPAIGQEFGEGLVDTDSVQADVEQIVIHDLDGKWEKRDFMRVCVSQAAIDPELGAAIHELIQQRQAEVIAARLQKHRDAGRIRPDVDIEAISNVLSGVGFSAGFMQRIAFGVSRDEAVTIAREAARAIARGISTEEQKERQ